jgi:hypothetical protein
VVLGLALVSTARSAAPLRSESANQKAPATRSADSLLKSDAWRNVPTTPLEPGEIDRLLDQEFQARKVVLSPLTTDEQFLRRLCLDLTGQLPSAAEVEQFVADKDPGKRARWIDKLLDSDEYARHWARYWRDVVTAVEAPFGNAHVPAFEDWLYEQFRQNRNWGEIVRALLTASGSLKKGDKAGNGAIFFLGRHNGPDADIEQAAETARLFLGVQLQCAQCHNDRRMKLWKQAQFHELAGFFARMGVGGSFGDFIKVTERKSGEHKMPTRESKQGTVTLPRFLDGQSPPAGAGDQERRKALADYLTSRDNYWFSAAYVNRIWNELLGQGFYERVDDLSPKSEVVFPAVAARLSAAFAGSNHDTKALLRAIVSSQAYQRQVRLGEAANQHLRFAAVYPARLRADVLWQSLGRVLVRMPADNSSLPAFLGEFAFDPSLKADEVAGTVSQALWLLNSPQVNDRVKVGQIRTLQRQDPKSPPKAITEPSLLQQMLAKHTDNDPAALRDLYLHALARKPTDRELDICLQYVRDTRQGGGTRNEAFEDVLKALINSAEFQRKL